MPKELCTNCGELHSTDMADCTVLPERTGSGRKSGKTSKNPSREVSPDQALAKDMSTMTLVERATSNSIYLSNRARGQSIGSGRETG